jgi:hypothetical protein
MMDNIQDCNSYMFYICMLSLYTVNEVEIKLHKISKSGSSNKQIIPGINHKTFNLIAPNSSPTNLVLPVTYAGNVLVSLYSTISVIRTCASSARPAIRHQVPDRRPRPCAGF